MIRVKERVGDDPPRSTPREVLIVNEDPHKLWYGECWVRLQNIPHKLTITMTAGQKGITSFSWIATSIGIDKISKCECGE
jgi:hypothetical protein